MLKRLETYVRNNFDETIDIGPLKDKKFLPLSLQNTYDFYTVRFFGFPCLLIESKEDLPRIQTLEKHRIRIEKLTGRRAVLYLKKVTWYRKRSLIEHRIPFIVEEGQMFLPFVGLDLKHDKKKHTMDKDTSFSKTTQVAFLYFLYHEDMVLNTTQVADILNVTTMTASRALNVLYDADLLTYDIGGETNSSKLYRRIKNPEYFKIGQTYMQSPVRKTVHVETSPKGALISGLESLAERTMLSAPEYKTRAMDMKQFKREGIQTIKDMDRVKDEGLVHLELWNYDPHIFKEKGHVDALSLYISMKNEEDERIEQALETLLRDKQWYTG